MEKFIIRYPVGLAGSDTDRWAAPIHGSSVYVADKRVARLLFLLSEIDESVANLDDLSQADLVNLISGAITACGFVNPVEARYAIAAVLSAIEGHPSPACA